MNILDLVNNFNPEREHSCDYTKIHAEIANIRGDVKPIIKYNDFARNINIFEMNAQWDVAIEHIHINNNLNDFRIKINEDIDNLIDKLPNKPLEYIRIY